MRRKIGVPETGKRKPESAKMRRFAQLVVLGILRAYKWSISPALPPACRYVPTCSEYAMEAVERYGVLRGGVMAIGRLLRCHPFVRGGYDPVVKRGDGSSEGQSRTPASYHGAIEEL
ncbi:Putative membrane protein insertion efficiency factor (modular protein) [Candidatus Sulfotelmatobacter kueseliae]|uniref:Putative membrane protein insertion efficiency factor n=1 Tax=Candidatus Sulfotelmatobacter kueseliae TaxID=2042962 RepID=A0A2U3LC94_9BACT|nr:Putative membrane protein insertion efficiency factor (modular protein) [Candidatus Sulfotelmatobacter kueseliae]